MIILFGVPLVAVLTLLPVTTWIVGWKLYREDRLFEAGLEMSRTSRPRW